MKKDYIATFCGKIIGSKGKILKDFPKKSGYRCVSLSEGYKKPNQTLVHRFVWEFFFGKIPVGMTIDHKNGIKSDNRLCNLQLLSLGENARKGNRILSDNEILELKSKIGSMQGKELAKLYNVSPQMVSNIKSGFRWGHVN